MGLSFQGIMCPKDIPFCAFNLEAYPWPDNGLLLSQSVIFYHGCTASSV